MLYVQVDCLAGGHSQGDCPTPVVTVPGGGGTTTHQTAYTGFDAQFWLVVALIALVLGAICAFLAGKIVKQRIH